jgi:hypothetical protein
VQGTVTFAPSPAAFGNVSLGSSQQLSIVATVSNFPVTFTSPGISPNLGLFTVVPVPIGGCTGTVSSGSTCTITVQFAPGTSSAGVGSFTGTLNVRDNGTGGPQPVTLTATGVMPPAATLASIAPNVGTHNTTVNGVILTGANFTATGNIVNVSGTGVTATITNVNATGSQITANFAITNGAAHTVRNVTVRTPAGTTGAQTFTVN